jgi:SAM-dependent methyltransferase
MNRLHDWYCRSAHWRRVVQQRLRRALDGVDVGGPVLELGPGPGLTTDVLVARAGQLTTVDIDPRSANRLAARLGDAVRVVVADATTLPLRTASFAVVGCFTMLHHVPTALAQDGLFAEAHRVLRPGGVFVGLDSLTSLLFRLAHLGDVHTPVDPTSLPARLRQAGFGDVAVASDEHAVWFRARRSA